jgi:hypothetical protein
MDIKKLKPEKLEVALMAAGLALFSAGDFNNEYYSEKFDANFPATKEIVMREKVQYMIDNDLNSSVKYKDFFDSEGKLKRSGEILGWSGTAHLKQRIEQDKNNKKRLQELAQSEQYKKELKLKDSVLYDYRRNSSLLHAIGFFAVSAAFSSYYIKRRIRR